MKKPNKQLLKEVYCLKNSCLRSMDFLKSISLTKNCQITK